MASVLRHFLSDAMTWRAWARVCLRLLAVWSLLSAASIRAADVPSLTELCATPLGPTATILVEQEAPLSLAAARQQAALGHFQAQHQSILTFGIGSRPVWIQVQFNNPAPQDRVFRLRVGATWIDRLDVYLLHQGELQQSWFTGDARQTPIGLHPGAGFVLTMTLHPGINELFIRADTADPMVLPLALIPIEQTAQRDGILHYTYGFFYGCLFALLAYNATLSAGLRERSYLYYSLYLLSFILLNLAYTGHGLAWLWSGHPEVQRYAIVSLMVLFGCAGLLFATRFLALANTMPRIYRGVQAFAVGGLVLQTFNVSLGQQALAARVAFAFVAVFTLLMVVLGILAVRARLTAARQFLAAVVCGALGVALTNLTVWGWLPMVEPSYHGAELGLLLEACLLAAALAYQMRHDREARLQAEHLARIDPLTNLYNRRAFHEMAAWVQHNAQRRQAPLTLIMLDIDHFKHINDAHGHDIGDTVLVNIAHHLTQSCRAGDVLARWGGEEFVILLPDTLLEQGRQFAERIRQLIEVTPIASPHGPLHVTVSLGVACLSPHEHLTELIRHADDSLYRAKTEGRNRVHP